VSNKIKPVPKKPLLSIAKLFTYKIALVKADYSSRGRNSENSFSAKCHGKGTIEALSSSLVHPKQ
jgi:hypothetical protein